MHRLIGQEVVIRSTGRRGVITDIDDTIITVATSDSIHHFAYPAALVDQLILRNSNLQKEYSGIGSVAGFDEFRRQYQNGIRREIDYLRRNGGKRYRAVDGIRMPDKTDRYLYAFDTDQELHFPESTPIKIYMPTGIVLAYVIACEEFTIIIQSSSALGDNLRMIEFTAEQWHLLEELDARLGEIQITRDAITYQLACTGRQQINRRSAIRLGQNCAMTSTQTQPITFIWGPPGTGKTKTLTDIAAEFLLQGKRVLMVSYSNVSVDGALLRMAEKTEDPYGRIVRYGYPRDERLLADFKLTSYGYILSQYPDEYAAYKDLMQKRKRLSKKDSKRAEITELLNRLRNRLKEKEQLLIRSAAFVATTVSKAVVDAAVYSQQFDLVLFDEASMAYVAQIVFAASLAKESFCCLGDFRQLPAIVQNPEDKLLSRDIFDYCGITQAVENGFGHDWLVMLNEQHRMHPAIADFVGQFMYDRMLRTDTRIVSSRQIIADCKPFARLPMTLLDLSGTYSVSVRTMDGSHINLLSAMLCVKMAEILVENYEVGVISPYSAQARLILAMIRDLRDTDEAKYKKLSSATVHQFQGSEKPAIIYDAVDCFRIPYPGVLLTSMQNNTANRLFNVAMTRAEGKLIVVANCDYMHRKSISPKLMFTKALNMLRTQGMVKAGDEIIEEIGTYEDEHPNVFLGLTDEEDSWIRYLQDIANAKKSIRMDIPGDIDNDPKALETLNQCLGDAETRGVSVAIRTEDENNLPELFRRYAQISPYVATPFTVIDQAIIWYGEPLSAADFVSEGQVIKTRNYLCMRFRGEKTARMLEAIFG